MAVIKAIRAREILDSRGNPTIETSIWSADTGATATIPSGASVGSKEALELRDNDPARFQGKGVLKAVQLVNQTLSKYLIGQDPTKQNSIDQMLINLDGTKNKSKLGANTTLSISQAVLELGARVSNMQTYQYIQAKYGLHQPTANNLPTPMFNIINGGKHGSENLDFQEYHVIPSSKLDFKQSLRIGTEIYHQLKQLLISKNASYSVGDEGGFAPNLSSNQDAISLIIEAIQATPYQLNQQVFLGLDLAVSEFYKAKQYKIKDRKEPYSAEDFIKYLIDLKNKFGHILLEDPLDQDSWADWTSLTSLIGQNTLIVGDDLVVTHPSLLKKAITKKACNAVIIKPNQVGTISEAVSVIKLAKQNNIACIVSHRSGDTNEDFLADFAVGVGADYVKFGAPVRGERTIKYNRLSLIQDYLTLSSPSPAATTAPTLPSA
jgi:enolase